MMPWIMRALRLALLLSAALTSLAAAQTATTKTGATANGASAATPATITSTSQVGATRTSVKVLCLANDAIATAIPAGTDLSCVP